MNVELPTVGSVPARSSIPEPTTLARFGVRPPPPCSFSPAVSLPVVVQEDRHFRDEVSRPRGLLTSLCGSGRMTVIVPGSDWLPAPSIAITVTVLEPNSP